MNICVFGASSRLLEQEYYEGAYQAGALIAKAGHNLVFGGGEGGIMGAAAQGALDNGGEITGISPRYFDNPGMLFSQCNEMIFTDTLRERKQLMEDMCDAFIALPGGIGTFDETIEVIAHKALGRHCKSLALLNIKGCYEPLVAMLRDAAERKLMGKSVLELFALCQTPEEAVEQAVRPDSRQRCIADYCK